MTLQEAETKLAGLNEKIDTLLKEREIILKEWNTAFHSENPDNIICVDENEGDCHNLYLINGDFKMHMCHFSGYDMNGSIEDFYKKVDNSIHLINIANGREYDLPDSQRNLIYAKAIEIKEGYQKKVLSEFQQTLSQAENDVENGNIIPIQDTMEELKRLSSMMSTDRYKV